MEIGPLAAVVLYISMTPHYIEREKVKTAYISCLVGWAVLVFFATTGEWIFRALGIGINSFNISSGLIFIMVGFGMLRGKDPMEKVAEGAGNKSLANPAIGIIPLGIPIIAGPGAVAFSIAENGQSKNVASLMVFLLAVTCAVYCLYLVFLVAVKSVRKLPATVVKLSYKLSGLFMLALGIQLMMNGINGVINKAKIQAETSISQPALPKK
jgi:multiple antibiotic resistance protein